MNFVFVRHEKRVEFSVVIRFSTDGLLVLRKSLDGCNLHAIFSAKQKLLSQYRSKPGDMCGRTALMQQSPLNAANAMNFQHGSARAERWD